MVEFEVGNGVWGPGFVKFPGLGVGSPWPPLCTLVKPKGVFFGLASWPDPNFHHSGNVGLKPAEQSVPSSLSRTQKVKSCSLDHALCLKHLRFQSIRS